MTDMIVILNNLIGGGEGGGNCGYCVAGVDSVVNSDSFELNVS
jgi:hypothetical protein